VIPIGDENWDRHRRPYIVIALILINVAVFIYELTLQVDQEQRLARFIMAYGAVPAEIWNLRDLPPQIDYPIWITIFTSMFMHGGWLHIGGNMLYLWIFGDNVEDAMGHVRFLLFYLLCGIGAALLQIVIDTSSMVPMVGASGAISGVLAAYLVMFPRRSVRVLVFLGIFVTVIALPALLVIGFWILLQFISGLGSLGPNTTQTGGVAYFAHIGGFLTGLLLAFLLRDNRAVARRRMPRQAWD
jgi:membrane associated rhomboid family serine protease